MIVEIERRRLAASAVRRFAMGELTNDEYEAQYPSRCKDPAVNKIYLRLWGYYDDIRSHRLTKKWSLDEDARDLWGRCVLFLESELPFRWPSVWRKIAGRLQPAGEKGDEWVWPFFTQEEFKRELDRVGGVLPLNQSSPADSRS